MKFTKIVKATMLVAMLLVVKTSSAQNIQLHYDMGRHLYSEAEPNRPKVTLTLEQFKVDNYGSWFYFVDVDMRNHGSVTAYTEIAREFNIKKNSPFAVHVEYDGGLNEFSAFQHVALLGAAYNGHSQDFSKTWSVQLMYRQVFGGNGVPAMSGAQLTGVWGVNFAGDKLTFLPTCGTAIKPKSEKTPRDLCLSPSRNFGLISLKRCRWVRNSRFQIISSIPTIAPASL